MKKTYVTNMPNRIGAFLKASKCFSQLGINITRVSYNKAIDSHKLFIDVEGEETAIDLANKVLEEMGYLHSEDKNKKIVLLEFCLKDIPGSVTQVLELIDSFNFNISYISSQENGSPYQYFKMGLYVVNQEDLTNFIIQANKLCSVKIVNYSSSEKNFDNSIFYNSYVDALVSKRTLSEDNKSKLLINVNLAMQTLDEQGLSPYKTFESIAKFSDILLANKNENFKPRITEHFVGESTKIILIEPPCGSNTIILTNKTERLFIDCGYGCYKNEMKKIFNELLGDFGTVEERVIVTHADVDHCGLLNEFSQVICTENTAKSLLAESNNLDGYRELNHFHKPYVNICKILTDYIPVQKEKVCVKWNRENQEEVLQHVGYFSFGEMHFDVYQGFGGHLCGETILIDYKHKIAFTGDIIINLKDLIPQQAEYNKYAPILMTSVDTNPKLSALEREAIFQRLGVGEWQIFGGHGNKLNYKVTI